MQSRITATSGHQTRNVAAPAARQPHEIRREHDTAPGNRHCRRRHGCRAAPHRPDATQAAPPRPTPPDHLTRPRRHRSRTADRLQLARGSRIRPICGHATRPREARPRGQRQLNQLSPKPPDDRPGAFSFSLSPGIRRHYHATFTAHPTALIDCPVASFAPMPRPPSAAGACCNARAA